MPDLMRPGKLSYVQIPARDPAALGAFYAEVFGWTVQPGSPDHVSFADASGELIGAFVTGRKTGAEPGILPYLSVANVDESLARAVSNGGAVEKPPYAEEDLRVAWIRDSEGNILGIWQAG